MEEVIAALRVLYQGTDNAQKQQANQWLQSFVTKREAWGLCHQLLSQPSTSPEIQYFAAQSLHTKIVLGLEELPLEDQLGLRHSLLEQLDRFKAGPQVVATQLCLCLAALAVQLAEWVNPVQDVTTLFASNPQTLSLLLEFLTVLPDEAENLRIPVMRDRRRAFRLLLSEASQVILEGLRGFIPAAPGNLSVHERVFKCLLGWVRAKAVPMEVLAPSGFVPLLLEGLAVEPLFDVSVDALCEVLSQTQRVSPALVPFVHELVGRVASLITPYKDAVVQRNEDVARGYCRIFVEAGEAQLLTIITHFETFGILTELILESTSHPNLDISQISVHFWYELAEELHSAEHRVHLPKFFSVYSRLMGVVINHLQYPSDLVQGWTAEQRDEFKDFRHKVGDTLKDCCAVIGGEQALELIYNYLNAKREANAQWQEIEAGLFAIRSMASGVDMSSSPILQNIMELILSDSLPHHSKIRYTVTLIIGRYAPWSKNNAAVLQPQIQYIVGGFSDGEVAPASALALKHLTKACDSLLAQSLPSLLEFHATLEDKLRLEDMLEITEAVANLISVLSAEQALESLKAFWLPVITSLNQLSLSPPETRQILAGKIISHLDRLTVFIKHVDPPFVGSFHPLMEVLTQSWPVFDRLFESYRTHEDVIEKLCRCLKYSIRTCKLFFSPLLEAAITRLVVGFKNPSYSAYLYAAREVVYQFGTNAGAQKILVGMLSELSATTFELLQRNENFVQHPDIVEDYFLLVKEYLEACPLDTLPFLESIFQCGLGGLTFNHREAIGAVVEFFSRLLGVSKKATYEEKMMVVIQPLVNRFGFHLVNALFQGASGVFPNRCLDDIADILREIMLISPDQSQSWMSASIDALGFKVGGEKENFLRETYHTYKGNGFKKVVKGFFAALRDRQFDKQ